MIAFWTCRRFSASSKMRLWGPSQTSAATSSPRWAGRQWRKTASWRRVGHQRAVDREALEVLEALLLLRLLPHRGPDVGVDGRGVLHRLRRIVGQDHLRAGRRGVLAGEVGVVRARPRTLGRGDRHVHPHLGGAEHQRVGHVVAVADVGELAAVQRLEAAEDLQRVK